MDFKSDFVYQKWNTTFLNYDTYFMPESFQLMGIDDLHCNMEWELQGHLQKIREFVKGNG